MNRSKTMIEFRTLVNLAIGAWIFVFVSGGEMAWETSYFSLMIFAAFVLTKFMNR